MALIQCTPGLSHQSHTKYAPGTSKVSRICLDHDESRHRCRNPTGGGIPNCRGVRTLCVSTVERRDCMKRSICLAVIAVACSVGVLHASPVAAKRVIMATSLLNALYVGNVT